jgi:hypothetical protein
MAFTAPDKYRKVIDLLLGLTVYFSSTYTIVRLVAVVMVATVGKIWKKFYRIFSVGTKLV